jgi:DNA-binding transcriptional LysR family regulator
MLPAVHQLRYFLAVAEDGQFTKAAERLRVAQPSVSAQIRRLEKLLGSPLFHRGPGPVTLTDAGATLLPIARRVVADLVSIEDEISGLDKLLRGHVAVGATPSLSTTLLPTVLGRFHRLHPGVAIRVSEQGSPQLVDELLAGTLDLALAIAPVQLRGLVSVALAEEELVVVTTPDHPLVRHRSVTVPQLAEHPMVMFRPGYDLRMSTLASFAEHGVEPTVAVEGGEMGSVLALVAAGLGAAVVPGIVTTGETRLRVTRFRKPPPTRTIALVRGDDRVPSRAAEALATAFTEGITTAGWPGSMPKGMRLLR